ncbi:MAG: hypothetical protein LHV68_07305 [Elusimicrobia bacterium]|nr:hypothetical protein [Candidatus Liberimonas magnetica]
MTKVLELIIKIIKTAIESSKLFLGLTGLLAVLIAYNYLTNKPELVIERYDPFVSVKMDLFYGLLRIRDGNKYDKIHQVEALFKDLKVPLCDESQDPDGRFIIFPLETNFNKNFIKLWNQIGRINEANWKPLSDEQKKTNHYNGTLVMAGYDKYNLSVSSEASFYLENIGDPWSFFSLLNIPAPKKYKSEKDNYYENVFNFNDNYNKDVIKDALDKIKDRDLKTDFLDSFNGSRQLWTPFVIRNAGDAPAKDISIIFQPGCVSGIHELIYSNLDHQGIGYTSAVKTPSNNLYVFDAKNNVLQIPILKPGETKIVVIKSISMLPGDEILRVKSYIGEQINRNMIKWWLIISSVLSFIYFFVLLVLEYKNENNRG